MAGTMEKTLLAKGVWVGPAAMGQRKRTVHEQFFYRHQLKGQLS
jgi:hypothetical protein